MPTKVIIDTDPGVDDIMALFFALRSPELDVIGLTTVFGNTDVEYCTQNALRVLEIAGRTDIPVVPGAGRPIVMPPRSHGKLVHGEDGLGNKSAEMPPITTQAVDGQAASFIVEQVMSAPGEVTLIPLGPLANIGTAVRLEPRIVENVKEVILMGGAATVPGNASPLAEANIHNDPEAASIVFSAGWKVTMVGLDVTTKVRMSQAYLDEITGVGDDAANLIGAILPFYQSYFERDYALGKGIFSHDPTALVYAVQPDLFTVEAMPIYVETEGRSSGNTIHDYLNHWSDVATPVHVCVDVDAEGVLALYRERMVGK